MAVTRLTVAEFLRLGRSVPVLDVRSPGEFAHARIPGAISMPLFNDEERAAVGTAYKQVSRQEAIKIGLDYFGPKMRTMVEQAEQLGRESGPGHQSVAIHCWRGGMRSGAVAWLLDLYGFEVYLLEGGYKAFRNWVLRQFEEDFNFHLVGGYTGSGKTEVLYRLRDQGEAVLDLEGLANHKGSAFGGLDRAPQPSSEQFENMIATELFRLTEDDRNRVIWAEDESQRIGLVNMPMKLWERFREKPLFFIDVPFEQRLEYITQDYGKNSKEVLINAIIRIQKRLGGLETKTSVNCLLEDDVRGCFSILLKYYDKHYMKALNNRPNLPSVMIPLQVAGTDPVANMQTILKAKHERTADLHR